MLLCATTRAKDTSQTEYAASSAWKVEAWKGGRVEMRTDEVKPVPMQNV